MDGRKVALWFALGLSLGFSAEIIRAQEPATNEAGVSSSLSESDVQKIVTDYLKTVEQRNSKEIGTILPQPQSQERHGVGAELQSKDYGLWFITPNRDFSLHGGLWMQFDSVWSIIRR
jgi:hypothetical protein